MDIARAKFVATCGALGVGGLVGTVFLYGVSLLVVGFGVVFGAGGCLIERATNFRLMQGQLSGWALAVGGAILGVLWFRKLGETLSPDSPWPFGIQYTATVLLCWAALLLLQGERRDEP